MTLLDTRTTAPRPVEIRDWVQALGRRLRLIVIVPLAAGALAGVVSLTQGHQYRTSTSVVIPHPQTVGSVSIAVSQSVLDFQGMLGSSPIASLTSQQTGASVKHIQGGLSSKRNVDGNSVTVTYLGTNPDTAQKVVVAASRNALMALAQANVTLADAQLAEAKHVYDAADADLKSLSDKYHVVDFPLAISQYERRLSDLRDQLGRAQDAGDQTAIAATQTKLTNLTSLASELKAGYQQANDLLNSADQSVTNAQGNDTEAKGELDAATKVVLTATKSVGLSRASHAARRVIPAMVFGLVLAVGVVVLLEMLRPPAPMARS